jgi:hypothetical protein
MTIGNSQRTCPKCGAQLTIERLDHHLTGQERMFCPKHGEIGSFRKPHEGNYPDAGADTDDER